MYDDGELNKTRVWKYDGSWRCTYYFPYGGLMDSDFDTWQDAMDFAWQMLEQRQWV